MRAFVCVVERGRFVDAAEQLRVQQSTISKWIARLEEELGVTLLTRTTRTKHLTEAGERFFARSKEIVGAFDAATEEARQRSSSPRGRIRISAPVVFGRLFVVGPVARFLRRHQEVEIELVLSDRYVSVVEDRFDVAIRVGVPVDSTLVGHALGGTSRRVVASPGYVKRHGAPSEASELSEHACLHRIGDGTSTRWTFRRGQREVGGLVRGRFSANHSGAIRAMARAGLGVGLLADWLVDDDLRQGRLVALLEDYEPPLAPIRALTPPARRVPLRVRAFIDFLAAELAAELERRPRDG